MRWWLICRENLRFINSPGYNLHLALTITITSGSSAVVFDMSEKFPIYQFNESPACNLHLGLTVVKHLGHGGCSCSNSGETHESFFERCLLPPGQKTKPPRLRVSIIGAVPSSSEQPTQATPPLCYTTTTTSPVKVLDCNTICVS